MMLGIRRSCSSSAFVTVAQRYMLGVTDSSNRSSWPIASTRLNRSSIEVAAEIASGEIERVVANYAHDQGDYIFLVAE